MGVFGAIDDVIDGLSALVSRSSASLPPPPDIAVLASLVGCRAVITDKLYVPRSSNQFRFSGVIIPLDGVDGRARYGIAAREKSSGASVDIIHWFNIYPDRVRDVSISGGTAQIDLDWPYGGGFVSRRRLSEFYRKFASMIDAA